VDPAAAGARTRRLRAAGVRGLSIEGTGHQVDEPLNGSRQAVTELLPHPIFICGLRPHHTSLVFISVAPACLQRPARGRS
jgi:hypothetical protein